MSRRLKSSTEAMPWYKTYDTLQGGSIIFDLADLKTVDLRYGGFGLGHTHSLVATDAIS